MYFQKYQHLERLGTTAVEGIQSGEVYVFPKLDGTNGSVWQDQDGNIQAGSRNRVLSYHSDNAGFYKWVLENVEVFKGYFNEYSNRILYGEWLVPHSLKTYRDDAWRQFYIFDVYQDGEPLHYREYSEGLKKFGLTYLSPIQIIKNGSDEHFRTCLEKNTYLVKEGEGFGEGVVLKNYGWINRFGQTIWAKVIANHFKETHAREMGAPIIGGQSEEEKIVDEFVTQHLVDKTYDKIRVDNGGWETKLIPRLLNTVYYDLIQEEMWEILKKFKQPKIDFRYLQRLTTQKIKELKPEVF